MQNTRRLILASIALSLTAGAPTLGMAKARVHHEDGSKLLGVKMRRNGNHVINRKGPYTTTVDVRDGKIAAMHVRHASKGDVAMTKYKSDQQLARPGGLRTRSAASRRNQAPGTSYIGYGYDDDFGNRTVYWYPSDLVQDGDTGAVDYSPPS